MTKKSNFVSPVYNIKALPIDDLVSQKSNPNSQRASAFRSLQMSIFNQRYVVNVMVGKNAEYNPETEGLERPNLLEGADGEETVAGDVKVGTQVSDDEIAQFFPYRLIDGSHRSQILRFGKHYFDEKYYLKAEQWFNGQGIPSKPGPEMMAYIAWREDFKIPVAELELNSVEQMSAEILANSARGSSGLDSMKILVSKLVKAGKSNEWIAENLNIDVNSIERMQTKSGLKSDFNDYEGLSMAWSSDEDDSYGRKLQSYLTREATKYIHTYNGDQDVSSSGSAIDIAESLGWNAEQADRKSVV